MYPLFQISLPEDTSTVSCEMIRRVRFHPTLDNVIAVLGTPGPVVTVLRSLGPALITDSLMVLKCIYMIY